MNKEDCIQETKKIVEHANNHEHPIDFNKRVLTQKIAIMIHNNFDSKDEFMEILKDQNKISSEEIEQALQGVEVIHQKVKDDINAFK